MKKNFLFLLFLVLTMTSGFPQSGTIKPLIIKKYIRELFSTVLQSIFILTNKNSRYFAINSRVYFIYL